MNVTEVPTRCGLDTLESRSKIWTGVDELGATIRGGAGELWVGGDDLWSGGGELDATIVYGIERFTSLTSAVVVALRTHTPIR